MFYTQSDRMFTENVEGRRTRGEGTRIPMHNIDNDGERNHDPEEASGSSSGTENNDGTWGERDIGGPVNFRHAMLDYEDMLRELSTLSKSRTGKTDKTEKSVATRASKGIRNHQAQQSQAADQDLEPQGDEKSAEEDGDDDFELGEFLKDRHFEKRASGKSAKKVGVIYKNLTVQGVGAPSTIVKTLPSSIIGVR